MSILAFNEALFYYLLRVSNVLVFRLNGQNEVNYCNSSAMNLLQLETDCPEKSLEALGFSIEDKTPLLDSDAAKGWYRICYHFTQKDRLDAYFQGFSYDAVSEEFVVLERYSISELETGKSAYVREEETKMVVLTRSLERKSKQLSRVSEMTRHLTTLDPLTDILNRRTFLTNFKGSIEQSISTPTTFGLAIINLDSFRAVNVSYGQLVSDEILDSVAKIIKKCIHGTDYAARISGDEYAVVLHATTVDKCRIICEKIRNNIKILTYDGKNILTASLGLTMYRLGDDEDRMMARADKAIYFAKSIGKNRLVIEY